MKGEEVSESQILHQRAVSLSKPVRLVKENTAKFICFKAADELYGISIASVTDVLSLKNICWLPGLPDYIPGVFNRRGEIISVVDFKAFLGFSPTEKNKDCGLIVIKSKEMETALLTDKVVGVLDIEAEKMQPPPSVLNKEEAQFLQGQIETDKGLIIILNVENVLNSLGGKL